MSVRLIVIGLRTTPSPNAPTELLRKVQWLEIRSRHLVEDLEEEPR